MQIPCQFLHVLGNELLHMVLNGECVCACMHVNTLTLITDNMNPSPHIYTQILGQPCPLRLPGQNTWVEGGKVSCSQGGVGKIFASAIYAPRNCGRGRGGTRVFSGRMASLSTPEGVLGLLPLYIIKEFTAPTSPVWVGMKLRIFHLRLGALLPLPGSPTKGGWSSRFLKAP